MIYLIAGGKKQKWGASFAGNVSSICWEEGTGGFQGKVDRLDTELATTTRIIAPYFCIQYKVDILGREIY